MEFGKSQNKDTKIELKLGGDSNQGRQNGPKEPNNLLNNSVIIDTSNRLDETTTSSSDQGSRDLLYIEDWETTENIFEYIDQSEVLCCYEIIYHIK